MLTVVIRDRGCPRLRATETAFRKKLSSIEKNEMIEVIDQYRLRIVPLVVPVTLIRHYVRKYDVAYLARQVFLHPHPVELMLRNHV